MSWLKEAQALIKAKNEMPAVVPDGGTDSPYDREALVKELRSLYENATVREIEKAINDAGEKLKQPYTKKELMDFLRLKLED